MCCFKDILGHCQLYCVQAENFSLQPHSMPQNTIRMRQLCSVCRRWFQSLGGHYSQGGASCLSVLAEQEKDLQRSLRRPDVSEGVVDGTLFVATGDASCHQPQDSNVRNTRGAKRRRQEQIESDNFSAVTYSPLGEEAKHDDDEADHVYTWDDETASLGSVDALVEPATAFDAHSVDGQSQGQETTEQDEETAPAPPPLGDRYVVTFEDAIKGLPSMTRKEEALVDLWHMLDEAGAPSYLYDSVVSFIEKHNGTTFLPGTKLSRVEALFSNLSTRFPVPKPETSYVALENGTEGQENYRRRQGDTVRVERWDFEEMAREYLLNPFLFGPSENLVNKSNPFGKYEPQGPEDRELLASKWYSDTYDDRITDPTTQFLMVTEMYLDKTGKNPGLGSYCGEPCIWASPLLTQDARQQWEAWRPMGYVPDLEVSSSAKKTQASGRVKSKGRSIRNYHRVCFSILESLIKCQQNGGFHAYVRMGNEVRYLHVVPVVVFVKGDAKSGDVICCRFGGKNCKARVPRLCMTAYKDLDDPTRSCPLVRMLDLRRLYELASRAPTRELKEATLQKCRNALKDTSTHFCDNAFFLIDFGSNQFGVCLATPSDMMHLFESGILKRVLHSFVGSMPTSV